MILNMVIVKKIIIKYIIMKLWKFKEKEIINGLEGEKREILF